MKGNPVTLYDGYGHPIKLEHRVVGQVASGVPLFGGMFNFDEGPELRDSTRRHETFRRMVTEDAYIAEAIRTHTLPLLSRATWDVEPWDSPPATIPPKRPAPGEEPPEPVQPTVTPQQKLAAEQAELVRANLYQGRGETFGRKFWAETSFRHRLREALKSLEHGFAMFHKQWKVVDGKRIFKRLLWLEPASVWAWKFKRDGSDQLEGIKRRYMKPNGTWGDETLPIEEIALYVWDMVGSRYESNPLTRPMFGPWKRKDFLLRCKMIALQRAGVGLPFSVRDAAQDVDETKDTSNLIEEFLQASLGSGMESAYLALGNPSTEFGYFGQEPTQAAKWDRAVSDENLATAHAGSTKAGMLGELPGGARAVGETQQFLQWVFTTAIGEIFIEQDLYGVPGTTGPVEDLLRANWPEVENLPIIELHDVDPKEKTRELPLLYDGIKAGIVKKRPALERRVLKRLKIDLTDEEWAEEIPTPIILPGLGGPTPGGGGPQPSPPGPPQPGPTPPGPAKPTPEPTPANAPPPKVQAVIAFTTRSLKVRANIRDFLTMPSFDAPLARDVGFSRQPTEFENQVLSLGTIQTTLTQGEARMASVIRSAHRSQTTDIVTRGQAGKITDGTLAGFRRSLPKGAKEQTRRVRETFLSIAGAGRTHAEAELDRQEELAQEREAASVAEGATPQPVGFAIRAVHEGDEGDDLGPSQDGLLPPGALIPAIPIGGPPLISTVTIEGLLGDLAGEATVTANVTTDGLWARLTGETIGELQRLQRQGLTGDALWEAVESFLNDLSEAPLDRAAREASTVSYNLGRDVANKQAAAAGRAVWALRSEILDGNTCAPCRLYDGTVVLIGSPAYESILPPAFCLGGDRCRGIIIPLADELVRNLSP